MFIRVIRDSPYLLLPWRRSPLALFLSTLRFALPLLSRSWRYASWLTARLTISALPLLSSAPRLARSCTYTDRRRGWRFIGARLPTLFSASRLAGTCSTTRWRARLAVARLSSVWAAATLTRTGTGGRWRGATLSSESFTAPLLWGVCGTTGLPRFRGWAESASLRLTLLRRWWRRRTEGWHRCPDRCACRARCHSGPR